MFWRNMSPLSICFVKDFHSSFSEEYFLGYNAGLATYFMLVSFFTYSSTPKTEVTCFSEKSLDFHGPHGIVLQKAELLSLDSVEFGMTLYKFPLCVILIKLHYCTL
jgi:hypothetical protein